LIELNGDVPLAHTEKAANPNRHVGDLAVLVEYQLFNIADLFEALDLTLARHQRQ
jgi:hypothetical protein